MSTKVRYTGTVSPYFAPPYTGLLEAWRPGVMADVSEWQASALLALGVFDLAGEYSEARWADEAGAALVRPDGTLSAPLPGIVAVAKPYRMASFGDSRSNAHSGGSAVDIDFAGASSANKINSKTVTWLEAVLGDTEFRYNFGVSGDTAAGWDAAARTSGKTIAALRDYAPDLVYIQHGINSYIAGTSTPAIVADLQELIAACLSFGAKVVFESTFPVSAASYGASAASKLAETLAGNALMRTYCAGFPGRVAYVDNTAALIDETGYLGSTYSTDGVHLNIDGAMFCAVAVAAAARTLLPERKALTYSRSDRPAPNLVQWAGSGPAMYTATESGTFTFSTPTWNIDAVTGEPYAECTMTCTVLASGVSRARFEVHATGISGGSPAVPIYVGDRLQGSARVVIDNGAGSPSGAQSFTFRLRNYADAKFADIGGPQVTLTTSKLVDPRGRMFTPAIVTAIASAAITAPAVGAGLSLQVILEFNAVGQAARIRLYAPCVRVVNMAAMPASVTLTASPMTYTNASGGEQDVVINANGGTVTGLTFNRSGAAGIATGLTGGVFRLGIGDGFTLTYSAGTPVITAVAR